MPLGRNQQAHRNPVAERTCKRVMTFLPRKANSPAPRVVELGGEAQVRVRVEVEVLPERTQLRRGAKKPELKQQRAF